MLNIKSRIQSLFAAAIWLTTAGIAFAQPNQPAGSGGTSGGDGTAYMFPYMIVLLALVLAMLTVARSSSRRERERPAGYVEKKAVEDD